jgi:hypothetical protein
MVSLEGMSLQVGPDNFVLGVIFSNGI